ncbi:MAG: hypothetical protein ACREJO_10580 [Phycisphaerales bacterium]
MKFGSTSLTLTLLALLALAPVLALGACSNEKQPAPANLATYEVEGTTKAATVQSVDYATRHVTLKWSDGVVTTYKVSEQAVNFNQIKPGDVVKASVAEAVAVYVGPSSMAPSASEGSLVALAAKGEKPGIVVADTEMVVARVTAINNAARTITVQGPAGNSRTLRVTPSADMSRLRVGDDVAARVSEAVAIWVEKP